jgi:hypothetical protein
MENTGTGFMAVYENILPGAVEFHVEISGAVEFHAGTSGTPGTNITSASFAPIIFTNTPPEILPSAIPAEMRRQNAVLTFDLNDFFYDADGDVLNFEIFGVGGQRDGRIDPDGDILTINPNSDILTIDLTANILTIDLSARANEDLLIHASDGRGGIAAHQISFSIVPWWMYYRLALLIITAIFFVLLSGYIFFFRRVKRIPVASNPALLPATSYRFSDARFEGYFLNTKSGKEIPILNWNAAYIENKHTISLGEMFNILDVDERLPEAHKIFFEAGNNKTVIFHHATDCVVSVGNKDIAKGKKEVLNFDNKLYIVFEDHSTEIEIRYKRVRKAVGAGL